jgi:uncharacterized protein (TIGR02001 family)
MQVSRGLRLAAFGLTGVAAAMHLHAQPEFGGSAALVSDFVDRGISQTCGNPAVQADVHVSSSGGIELSEAFAGLWGSRGLGGTACGDARELDIYGGYRVAVGSTFSGSLTYTHYAFPGGGPSYLGAAGQRFDYDELEGAFAYEDQLYATIGWTPDAVRYDYYGYPERNRSALSYGLQLHRPIDRRFSLIAGAGYERIGDPSGTGYAFWNTGVGYSSGRLELDLVYFWAGGRAERLFGSEIAGGRVSGAAVWRF